MAPQGLNSVPVTQLQAASFTLHALSSTHEKPPWDQLCPGSGLLGWVQQADAELTMPTALPASCLCSARPSPPPSLPSLLPHPWVPCPVSWGLLL